MVGPILTINELKSIFAADPISMFGGSPIRVAVPPTFDASTSAIMNGIGDILSVLNTDTVMGTINSTVVTLSINIETVAVKMQKRTISFHIFPFDALLIFIPRYWNTPVSPNIATIIIIPNNRPIVLKSIALITKIKLVDALKRPVTIPISITNAAPTIAAVVL
jgi:hypothetical protein